MIPPRHTPGRHDPSPRPGRGAFRWPLAWMLRFDTSQSWRRVERGTTASLTRQRADADLPARSVVGDTLRSSVELAIRERGALLLIAAARKLVVQRSPEPAAAVRGLSGPDWLDDVLAAESELVPASRWVEETRRFVRRARKLEAGVGAPKLAVVRTLEALLEREFAGTRHLGFAPEDLIERALDCLDSCRVALAAVDVLVRMDHVLEARELCETWLMVTSDERFQWRAWMVLGHLHREAGSLDESCAAFDAAADCDTSGVDVWVEALAANFEAGDPRGICRAAARLELLSSPTNVEFRAAVQRLSKRRSAFLPSPTWASLACLVGAEPSAARAVLEAIA